MGAAFELRDVEVRHADRGGRSPRLSAAQQLPSSSMFSSGSASELMRVYGVSPPLEAGLELRRIESRSIADDRPLASTTRDPS